ncbi:hypothetical protein F7D09_0541 [Bifidobacterium leontopitheci]|uniref:Uncharacterized protein n=1 Tax=Bifidobacterium leontopitheci TaxID=2650774 RepID=A0A6I1GH88_9BIFI|nr:hypothetical protein F7D09_0541 [Bifidobacterium leontopitheci]
MTGPYIDSMSLMVSNSCMSTIRYVPVKALRVVVEPGDPQREPIVADGLFAGLDQHPSGSLPVSVGQYV